MRRLPWRRLRAPHPDHPYVLSVGVFVLDRYRTIPGFIRRSFPVRRLLHRTDGLAGYTLHARFGTKTFTELAAFESPEAMRRFVSAPAHAAAMRAMRPHLAPGSKMVTVEVYGRDLPPRTADISARLEAVPGFEAVGGPEGRAVDGAGAGHAPGAHAGPEGPNEPLAH